MNNPIEGAGIVYTINNVEVPADSNTEHRLIDESKQIGVDSCGYVNITTHKDCLIEEQDNVKIILFSDRTPRHEGTTIGWGINSEACRCCGVTTKVKTTDESGNYTGETREVQGCRAHIAFRKHLLTKAGQNLI